MCRKQNREIEMKTKKSIIEKAALMIFSSRICFNGLYRATKKELFNVSGSI